MRSAGSKRGFAGDLRCVGFTKWGSLGSGDGQFDHPNGVAVGASGNVWAANSDNHRVQKFTPQVLTVADVYGVHKKR